MDYGHLFYVQVIADYIKKTYSNNQFYWMSDLKEHDNVPMVGIPNPKKDRTYSTTLLNTSDTHILTMDMSNLTTHSSLYSEQGELQKG